MELVHCSACWLEWLSSTFADCRCDLCGNVARGGGLPYTSTLPEELWISGTINEIDGIYKRREQSINNYPAWCKESPGLTPMILYSHKDCWAISTADKVSRKQIFFTKLHTKQPPHRMKWFLKSEGRLTPLAECFEIVEGFQAADSLRVLCNFYSNDDEPKEVLKGWCGVVDSIVEGTSSAYCLLIQFEILGCSVRVCSSSFGALEKIQVASALPSCSARRARPGDIVRFLGSARSEKDILGYENAWTINKGEPAMVVEVRNNGFELLNLRGVMSACLPKKGFHYASEAALEQRCCWVECRHPPGIQLSTCSRCGFVKYCSQQHATLHWNNGHRDECDNFAAIRNKWESDGRFRGKNAVKEAAAVAEAQQAELDEQRNVAIRASEELKHQEEIREQLEAQLLNERAEALQYRDEALEAFEKEADAYRKREAILQHERDVALQQQSHAAEELRKQEELFQQREAALYQEKEKAFQERCQALEALEVALQGCENEHTRAQKTRRQFNRELDKRAQDLDDQERRLQQQQQELLNRMEREHTRLEQQQMQVQAQRLDLDTQRQKLQKACVVPKHWCARHEEDGYVGLERVTDKNVLKGLQLCLKPEDRKQFGVGKDQASFADRPYNSLLLVDAWRIENVPLWAKYTAEKSKMQVDLAAQGDKLATPTITTRLVKAGQALPGTLDSAVCEAFLLHGTSPDNVQFIVRDGVNERFTSRCYFGFGAYFCEDAAKADQYVTPHEDHCDQLSTFLNEFGSRSADKCYYIFLCRAALGHAAQTKDGRETLDGDAIWAAEKGRSQWREFNVASRSSPPMRYHSQVVEVTRTGAHVPPNARRVERFREFVLTHSERVYPEYLMAVQRTQQ